MKIAFTGDLMLSRKIGVKLKSADYQESSVLSEGVLDVLRRADLVVGNLECPLAEKAERKTDTSFKASPKAVSILNSFHHFSLANNHIFDCGKLGAQETINNLVKAGKAYSGILNNNVAEVYTLHNVKGKKIAFISCAVDYCIKNESGDFPFVLKATSPKINLTIKELKSQQDVFIVILIHGGNEMISYPEPSFRELCRSYVDFGADVVVSNHPHVLGGLEEYKQGKIFYSLGDFIFDGQSFKRRKSVILILSVFDEIKWNLVPLEIDKELKTSLTSYKKGQRILKDWNKRTNLYKGNNYDKFYKSLYLKSLIYFQVDRIFFLIKNEGFLFAIKFLFKKASLIKFYFASIKNNQIK